MAELLSPMCREQQQYSGYKLSSGPVEAPRKKTTGSGGQKKQLERNEQTGATKFSNSFRRIYPSPLPPPPEVYSLQNTFMCINLILALTQSSRGGKVGILKGKNFRDLWCRNGRIWWPINHFSLRVRGRATMTHPPCSFIHSQKCSDNKSSSGIAAAPRPGTGAGFPAPYWGCYIDSDASAYARKTARCRLWIPGLLWTTWQVGATDKLQRTSRQFCREVWLFQEKAWDINPIWNY